MISNIIFPIDFTILNKLELKVQCLIIQIFFYLKYDSFDKSTQMVKAILVICCLVMYESKRNDNERIVYTFCFID